MPLSARELRQLEGARLNPRKSFGGRVRGERTTKKKGVSIEFADYRDYTEGDDLRHVDWNVLARLDSAVMRTYRDEEDLAVYLLIDASESMRFGEPSKLDVALESALALAYVGLLGGDAIHPVSLGAREPKRPPFRGSSAFAKLLKWRPESASVPLVTAIRQFANGSHRAGLVVLATDGLDPEIGSALRLLAGRGHEIFLLQVLSDVEIDPDIEGDVRLVDSESNTQVELTANGLAVREYRQNLERHNAVICDAVRSLGGKYTLVPTSQSVETSIKSVWRREGWIA